MKPFVELWSPLAAALGWMIVHSLWQIALLYLAYRLLAWRLASRSAVLYYAALIAMAGSIFWAASTLAEAFQLNTPAAWAPARTTERFIVLMPASPIMPPAAQSAAAAWSQQFFYWCDTWAAPIGWLWSLGALVFSLRLMGGYWLSQRIRRVGVAPVPPDWAERCRDICRRLGIRKSVVWLESERIAAPLTLGFWKPVILFPAGLLLQLRPEQVETLLLHELAHIRRYDYTVNLIQLMLEVCFFYHPLFWLLSREARRHREYCCDDLVCLHTSSRLLYAQTLTQLKIASFHTKNEFAMHATGKSAFAQRIFRLAGIRPEKNLRSLFLLSMPFLLLFVAMCWLAFVPNPQSSRVELALALPESTTLASTLVVAPAGPLASTPGALSQPTPGSPDRTLSPVRLADTLQPPAVVAIEVNKMNVFYIGVDNPITVAVPDHDCQSLQVRLLGEGGKIIPLGNCTYNVVVSRPGTMAIEVYSAADTERQTLLGVKTFRVKRIPDPVVVFERPSGNIIAKADIRTFFSRPLQAWMQNFDFDAACEIIQFSVACMPSHDADVVEFYCDGNRIPPDRLDYLETLPARSKIYILDIKIKCPGDTAARKMGDLVFEIVE
ncbi:MAG: M48 family metalloprotease [Saprospirales bacterium]|nr:M48 family metalloprotease [Saprospirales bacterium]